MMKKQLISSLVLFSLLILAVGIHANISFNSSSTVPVISDGGYDEFVKYIDIVTEEETWSHSTAYVVVAAWADGLGIGQGTLVPVTILGQTYATYQDTPDTVGSTSPSGSWTTGTKVSVGADIEMAVPKDKEKSYSWSASGNVKLTPHVWQESVSIGGAIRWPVGVQGTFTTSGTWKLEGNSSTTRSAAAASGTHTVKFKYRCDVCKQSGDTAAAIGGKEAHEEGECPGSDCSVRYRKCTPPVGHKIIVCPGSGCSVEYRECSVPEGHRPCPSCGARECEVSNKASSGCSVCQSTTTPSTSLHPCGEHPITASGDHTQQASCSVTNNRRQRCTVTNFYACQSHTHTYRTMRCPRTLGGGAGKGGFGIGGFGIAGFNLCSKGGYLTTGDNHRSTCRLRHAYWNCDPSSVEQHKARTCARCNKIYQNCEGASNPCTSGLGHSETADPPAEAPSTPQPNPSPPSETPAEAPSTPQPNPSPPEEQEREEEETTEVPAAPPARPTAVCGSGHTYFTDVSYARSRHRDRTCTRCSQTYQNCGNSATACQGSRWHTEDPSATPTPSPPTETPSETPSETPTETPSTPKPETPAPEAPSAPAPTRLPCGHLSTAEGNHIKQASCSETNGRGDRCTVTNFYACQSHTHRYPAPTPTPAPPPTVVCPANSWTNCGGTTSHASTCSGGHSYYTCGTANAWHQDRTCTRCSQTYQNCGNSATACQSSKWHTETPQVVLVACGAASWTGCTSQLTSSTEHQVSCSSGHSYWTCGTSTAWHQDRTCTRCSQTYQNCSNSATACQGSRWHTE